MSLNETVSAERVHIAFFGLRNAGKSSLVNAVTGQRMSIVSPVPGTTTDAVRKSMELLPLGPVVIIDTPGIDDEGELGTLRVNAAKKILARADVAVLVIDSAKGKSRSDEELIALFDERKLPFIVAFGKSDLTESEKRPPAAEKEIFVSAKTGENIGALKELIASLGRGAEKKKPLVSDLIPAGGIAVLVIPIDKAAPKGRLILPQQQVMRDVLDSGASFAACQPEELPELLELLGEKVSIVITDSQAFGRVAELVPETIPMTSFSIIFARFKGELRSLLAGAEKLASLSDGEKVLISEGCTHHRQCGDIGTEKLPKWIEGFCGKKPDFRFSSGLDFPDDLSDVALVVHCGGCMLNEKEMRRRMEICAASGVPMVNYGVAIAKMHGILDRAAKPFEEVG